MIKTTTDCHCERSEAISKSNEKDCHALKNWSQFFSTRNDKKANGYYTRTLFDLVILFLASLTPLLWFSGNKILTGHDSGFPLNPLMHFLDRLFLWTNRFGFGKDQTMETGGFFIHGQEALLQTLGFPLQDTQKIIFVSWFFLLGLAIYIFSRVLFDQRKYRYLGVIAALFYMFNTYTIQSWPVVERAKFSMMIALPLILSVLIKFFEERLSTFKAASLVGLILLFFNAAGANGLPHLGAMAILALTAFLFLFFLSWQKSDTTIFNHFYKKIFLFGALTLIIFFFLSSYWLLPLWHLVQNSYAAVTGARGAVSGSLAWLDVISKSTSIFNLLRLQGEPGWYGLGSTHPYGQLYLQNPFLIIISFLWPLLAIGGVIISRNKERERTIFLLLIGLTAIFFSSGSHFPTGVVFDFLFEHIPGFLILRSAWFKFNYGISFAYSVLVAYFISKIYLWLAAKKQVFISRLLLSVFFIIMALYNFPYFSQQMFVWNKPLSLMVDIPKYIFDFGRWSESLPSNTRFLVLPPLDKQWSGLAYSWGYFSSTTPHAVLTNRTMYSNYESLPANEKKLLLVVYDDLLFGREQEAQKILSLLQVDYLLLEKDALSDLGWYKTTSPSQFSRSLAKISWIVPDKTFGEWQVYKVKNEKSFEPISLSSNAIITNLPTSELISYINGYKLDVSMPVILGIKTPESDFFPQNFVWKTECLNCEMEKINFSLPEVKILPGSRFYKYLVENKEKKLLANANNLDFSQKLDLYTGLSLKRLAEIDRLTEQGKYEKALLPLNELKINLAKLNNLLTETKEPEVKLVFSQKRLFNFSQFAGEKLNFFKNRGINKQLETKFGEIFQELSDIDALILEHRLWKEIARKIYLSDIPASGEYQIQFLDKNISNVQLYFDGQKIEQEQLINISKGQHIIEAVSVPETKKLSLVFISLNQKENIPAILPKIIIKQIDQTKYLLNTQRPEDDFFLYFADTFNSNWIVYVDDKPISKDRQFLANGFGNAWFIKPDDFRKEGFHTISLAYLPQSFFQLGMVISGVSFIAIVLSLVVSILL